jgi:hypothetical protein
LGFQGAADDHEVDELRVLTLPSLEVWQEFGARSAIGIREHQRERLAVSQQRLKRHGTIPPR